MNEPVILAVWLVGLFGLIGIVLAAVARLVIRDTTKYDKQFTWSAFGKWNAGSEAKETGKD